MKMVTILIIDHSTNKTLRTISKQIIVPAINDEIYYHDTNKQYIVIGRRFTYSFTRDKLLTVKVIVKSQN